jgi:UDP-N-acetylmuramoyl-tripeptide--D-alanyl-D-alanine ligase
MHTVEAVAQENGCVIAGLDRDGVAVFPGDDTYTALWQGLAGQRRSITFGLSAACNARCTHSASHFGSELQVTTPHAAFVVRLAAAGLHNVRNALAAIACTLAAGVPVDAIVRGLESFAPVNGRLQRKTAANGAVVIDDTYNANPDSVRAAIDVLAQAASPRVLVLGDMGEVGTQGREFHEEIAAYAAAHGIDAVLVTGELTRHMMNTGGAIVRHFEQFDELLAALDFTLGSNSDATVLVKGSRFMKMERVVAHLIAPLASSTPPGKEAH